MAWLLRPSRLNRINIVGAQAAEPDREGKGLEPRTEITLLQDHDLFFGDSSRKRPPS